MMLSNKFICWQTKILSDAIDERLDKRDFAKKYDDNEDYIEMTPDTYDAIIRSSLLSKLEYILSHYYRSTERGVYLLNKKDKTAYKPRQIRRLQLSQNISKMLTDELD